MGFMDKLQFWKKNDPLTSFDSGLGSMDGNDRLGLGAPTGLGSMNQSNSLPTGMPQMGGQFGGQGYPSYPQPQDAMSSMGSFNDQRMMNKELEVISSKLDSLKMSLDNLNQRLENLERIAMQAQNPRW